MPTLLEFTHELLKPVDGSAVQVLLRLKLADVLLKGVNGRSQGMDDGRVLLYLYAEALELPRLIPEMSLQEEFFLCGRPYLGLACRGTRRFRRFLRPPGCLIGSGLGCWCWLMAGAAPRFLFGRAAEFRNADSDDTDDDHS